MKYKRLLGCRKIFLCIVVEHLLSGSYRQNFFYHSQSPYRAIRDFYIWFLQTFIFSIFISPARSLRRRIFSPVVDRQSPFIISSTFRSTFLSLFLIFVMKLMNRCLRDLIMCGLLDRGSMRYRWDVRGMDSMIRCETFHVFSNIVKLREDMSQSGEPWKHVLCTSLVHIFVLVLVK